MDFATNDEILYAHDQLLSGKKTFDQEHVDIIKANDSRYIQACPGSGKTTTLLAKLLILANRMPFEDGRGVCVLTHTNVAIDEIKARLGSKADILFRYPNFFGTLQTFVHKYIADLALFYFYGSHIEIVDNDIATSKLLYKLNKNRKSNCWAYVTRLAFNNSKYELTKDDLSVLWKWLYNTNYDITNNKIIYLKKNGNKGSFSGQSSSGQSFKSLKEELFSEGILNFDDAYQLAFRFINEIATNEKKISLNRFKYVFVDEMQDCDVQQRHLIDLVFNDSEVILQRFGDYCQSIFNNSDLLGECTTDLKNQSKITLSNRFGDNIAKPLRTICIEDNTDLKGNPDVPSLMPTILVYENPRDVLPKFVELLKTKTIGIDNPITIENFANMKRQVDPLNRINIKAIGWRAKSGKETNLSLSSYFPAFVREMATRKIEMSSIVNYLSFMPNITPKTCADNIINAIIQYLDLSAITNGNRRYTKASFLAFLEEKNKLESFKERLMDWVMDIYKNKCKQLLISEISQYIDNSLIPLFGGTLSAEAKKFATIKDVAPVDNPVNVSASNIYKSGNTEIEIATVHSVKGETHVATLYLETFFNRYYESQRAGDQIKGEKYNGDDPDTLNTLKVMYVGMSRPSHFLCFAIKKERFDLIDSQGLRNIWDIVYVDQPNALF